MESTLYWKERRWLKQWVDLFGQTNAMLPDRRLTHAISELKTFVTFSNMTTFATSTVIMATFHPIAMIMGYLLC